jgi:hypothetical protein
MVCIGASDAVIGSETKMLKAYIQPKPELSVNSAEANSADFLL